MILTRNGFVLQLCFGSTWSIRCQNPHGTAFCMIISYRRPELFSLIKSDFLNAIVHLAECGIELHEFLVLGCFWHQNNDAYITFEETRQDSTEN